MHPLLFSKLEFNLIWPYLVSNVDIAHWQNPEMHPIASEGMHLPAPAGVHLPAPGRVHLPAPQTSFTYLHLHLPAPHSTQLCTPQHPTAPGPENKLHLSAPQSAPGLGVQSAPQCTPADRGYIETSPRSMQRNGKELNRVILNR